VTSTTTITFFVATRKKKKKTTTTIIVVAFFIATKPKEKVGRLPSSSRSGLSILGPVSSALEL